MKQERDRLITHLKQMNYIKTKKIEQAMLSTQRELFVPENIKPLAYQDTPHPIGKEQTISAPHMVAIMCEALDLKKGQQVLEIGAGSGYHAAVVSKIIGSKGHVYSIERVKSLATQARENLNKANIKNVTVIDGDGSLGLKKHGPYDRIYITCAAPIVPPPLIKQLKEGGKLLIPLGSMVCTLQLIEKQGEKIIKTDHGECVFVPLIGAYGHKR